VPTRAHKTGFLKRTLRLGGKRYLYQVYLPPSWKKSTKFPVILFLHGAGERGSDGDLQTRVGAGTAIRAHAERFPFIVVFPQCRRDSQWPKAEMQSLALKTLEHAVKEFNGDTRRIYLTGISMGGYGVWTLGAANPGKFAALVVICGGVHALSAARRHSTGPDPYVSVAEALGHSPAWIFHGADDPAVPVAQSRRMHDALKHAGGNVRYSEYPGVGHNSWDKAYSEPGLVPWLLSQSLATHQGAP